MITRRKVLEVTAQAGAALTLAPRLGLAQQAGGELITRPIPATGEEVPIIGLGSSATFSQAARAEDFDAVRGVLEKMLELGGTVFDTAPSYGASEEVAG